jgi:uncharacterized damage-inducible protein DinB
MDLRAVYGDWRRYNDLVLDAVRAMSAHELALHAPPDDPMSSASWPIWAILGHTAGARVYWLSTVMGLPGADDTPFGDAAGSGWEDDLGRPRTAEELVVAWTTTWAMVDRALDEWTIGMLDEPVVRGRGPTAQRFTRRSILMRLITHEAYHAGQIAVIQAIHGRPQIDLWPAGYHTIDATTAPQT